jgi:ZIP family zinc transporter
MARGSSKAKVLGLWTGTALLLSAAALAGDWLLTGLPQAALAMV